jgi:hypothetical protein
MITRNDITSKSKTQGTYKTLQFFVGEKQIGHAADCRHTQENGFVLYYYNAPAMCKVVDDLWEATDYFVESYNECLEKGRLR